MGGAFLTPPADSLFKKLHHIKNLHQLKARLFKTDEPKDCNIVYEDHTTPHCSTTYNEICEDEYKDEWSTDYTTKAKEEELKQGTAPWELPEAKTEAKEELKQGTVPWELTEAKTEAEEEQK